MPKFSNPLISEKDIFKIRGKIVFQFEFGIWNFSLNRTLSQIATCVQEYSIEYFVFYDNLLFFFFRTSK